MQALQRAVSAGWRDASHVQKDPDLESLRSEQGFAELVEQIEARQRDPIEIQPTTGFRSTYIWNQLGARTSDQGLRYFLSTVLAVTSGRGNSIQETLGYLRRSVESDGTRPGGTVYLMENGNVRSTTRQWAFASTVKALQGTPVTGAVVSGITPRNQADVAGAVLGSASVDWQASGSTIRPGAICENLTSAGGMMQESAGQTPLTEFLRFGAAGSSGTVTEPYAIQAKFPCAFLHVHYARGCSLAEAFYQSVFGPYQLLIVGDALCQPWASPLPMEITGLTSDTPVSGAVAVQVRLPGATRSQAAVDHFEVFVDGRRVLADQVEPQFTLDTRELGDGWHELRVVAVAADSVETQSRALLPFVVDQHGETVTLNPAANGSEPVRYGESCVVRAEAPGGTTIKILHNSRVVGTISAAAGTCPVDTRILGIGPVTLQASARLNARTCFSRPVTVNVLPPPPLPAVTDVPTARLAEGIQVRLDDDPPLVVTDTRNANWLSKLHRGSARAITLSAVFECPEDDLYQFQFQGNSVTSLAVSGRVIWTADTPPPQSVGWTMVPVSLERGWHRLRLEGMTGRTPSLQIRFGGRGTRSLDGKRFQHVPD
jgi:hypothetical protein